MDSVAPFVCQRIVETAMARGVDPKDLPAQIGAERVPLASLERLWASAVRAEPTLPVEVARSLRLDDLHLLGFLLNTAPTGMHAVRALSRFYGLLSTAARFSLHRLSDRVALRFESARAVSPLISQAALLQTISCARQLMPALDVKRIFTRAESVALLRDFAECPVERSKRDEIVLGLRALQAPCQKGQARLFEYLWGRAEEARAPLFAAQSWSARASAAIDRAPAATAEDLALKLGVSPRTLRRRLKEEGASLGALRDEAREKIARRSVAQGVSQAQVAHDLGYSDQSSLCRALRRARAREARESPC